MESGTDRPTPPPGSANPADWDELQQILSPIRGTASAPIANVVSRGYTRGMLLGNGDLGVVVGGDTAANQKFYFGKNDFEGSAWDEGHSTYGGSLLSLGSLTLSAAVAPATAG